MVHVDDPPLDTLVGVQLIVPPAPADADTAYWFNVKLAVTEQLLVTLVTVYVFPDNVPPPQVSLTDAVYPVFGVTVNVVEPPLATVFEAGDMVPPEPLTEAVTVSAGVNVAAKLHAPVIGAVVNVLPFSVPEQPVTVFIWYPAFGVSVKLAVLPCFTVWLAGLTLPPPPLTDAVIL
ncbi:hypothetical protein ASN18_3345 [Candidatus Magnetominusculus xianensis]|uniref:Uncharacterized protein n=1 Tax=Candidatus Magnetominusculus xianensis TaxID=1748249 RepID=A0ABR5SAQ4_9BACT|nr:hypothetical protein ASN18_3345 [Candidatus Magnetominusculus xianensis]